MKPKPLEEIVPLGELDFQFVKSSGKGGQNVNKVNTKAVMTWAIFESESLPEPIKKRFVAAYGSKINQDGEVCVSSDRFRSQKQNMEDCVAKLYSMIASVRNPPKKRKPTKPSRSQREERLANKKQQSEKKANRRRVDY